MTENLAYPLLSLIPALLNAGIIIYILVRLPKGRTTDVFTLFVLALTLWQAEDTILRLTDDAQMAVFWDRVFCAGWLSAGPLLFHFACRYAGLNKLLSRPALIATYLPFICLYLIYIANTDPHILTRHESWGWVFSARPDSLDALQRYFISLFVLAAVFILFRHAYRSRHLRLKRTQTILVATGIFLPAAQGILTQVIFPQVLHWEEIPLTSTFLTFFSIATIVSLGRFRLFDLTDSVDINTILSNLTNIVMIVSPDKKIIYLNHYASNLFGLHPDTADLRQVFNGDGRIYHNFCTHVVERTLSAQPVKNYATSFHANGKQVEVLVSSQKITNNNQVQGILLVANDITEKLRTLRDLESSNERFEYVTQASFDAIWDWDLVTDTVYWGKGMESLFGYTVADMQNGQDAWSDYLHPDDRERVLQRVEHTIRSRKRNWSDEYRFRKANGEYAHVADKGLVIRDEGGVPLRMIGAMQDVTIAKEQVNEIYRMQQNLNSLINNTTDKIWSVDHDLKIITANKAFSIAVEKLSGKPVQEGEDVLVIGIDDDLKKKWEAHYRRALTGESFNVDNHFTDAEGKTSYSIISFNPMSDATGNVTGVACFAKDVTDLKKAEKTQQGLFKALQKRAEELAASHAEKLEHLEALRASNERYNLVSKATNDMVWDWDLGTGIVYRNEEGWKKIFHCDPPSGSGTEADWEAMIHPDDLDKLKEAKRNVCADNTKDFFEIEARIRRNDGTYAWILDRGYVVRDASKKPLRLIGASHDITEKKKAEQELKEEQLKRQREITDAVIGAQEEERRKIGAELHDNVNQILACTLLYLSLAKKEGQDKEFLFGKADMMLSSAIEEIRKLSHTLIPPSLNGENLSEALGRLIEPAEKAGLIEVEKDFQFVEEDIIPEKLKLTIYRIIQEQFNNILKYAKATKVSVQLMQDGGDLLLVVRDNGIGFQNDGKSNGVGLLNIRTRAYLHNGIVRIVSSPGNGCTLYVSFPFLKEGTQVEEKAQASEFAE